jgi:hypothetical protein
MEKAINLFRADLVYAKPHSTHTFLAYSTLILSRISISVMWKVTFHARSMLSK